MRCLFWLLFIAGWTCCWSEDLEEQVEYHFEWGEYDSVIVKGGQLLQQEGIQEVNDRARLHLYLGAALFSDGRVGKAREQVVSACRIDSTITLPRDYLSTAMVDFMVSTRAEFIRQQHALARRDSLLKAKDDQVEKALLRRAVVDSLNRIKARNRTVGILGYAISAALVSGSVFQYRAADGLYQDFLHAARNGYREEYEHLKTRIRRKDAWGFGMGSGGVMAGVVSTVFLIRSHRMQTDVDAAIEVNPGSPWAISAIHLTVTF